MDNSIFRKKSLDKISSPEQLNEYIKVARPSVFIFLAAVVVMLVGICAWSIFGTLDTTVSFAAVVVDGNMNIYIGEDLVAEGDALVVEGEDVTVSAVSSTPVAGSEVDHTFFICLM